MIADKQSGFASLRLNQMCHLNDLKWTKPGHLTLKIYAKNLSEHSRQTEPPKSKHPSSRIQHSSTADELLSLRNCHSHLDQSFSAHSDLSAKLEPRKGQAPDKFVFAALQFSSEFECSKFYDFYRALLVDSQNDDLFNPHCSRPQGKMAVMKVFLKKITKSSISGPVAFRHVNSLSGPSGLME